MKKINKKNRYNSYADGSTVTTTTPNYGAIIGTGGNLLGQAVGGTAGSALSGAASGAAAGLALGPEGAIVGGVLGGAVSLLGSARKNRILAQQKQAQYTAMKTGYNNAYNSSFDTDNENPYGTDVFADGGIVGDPTKPTPYKHVNSDGSYLGDLGAKVLNYLQSPETEKSLKHFRDKGGDIAKSILQAVDETGVSGYPDVINDFANGSSLQKKAMDIGGSLPGVGEFFNTAKNANDMITNKKFADGGPIDPKPRAGYDKFKSSLPSNLQYEGDYDLQGYYNKYGDRGPAKNGHLTDEFKLPNHPTFSNESKYYNLNTRNTAGFWTPDDVYVPFNGARPAFDEKNNKNIPPMTTYQQASGKFADGGEVPSNIINIEKGELQIDPQSGKVLRSYTGINPEAGTLYQPHKKGQDPEGNFVTATPGSFVVTTAKAPLYKKAIDNNDKLAQNTILQNIKNAKDNLPLAKKMALGSYVDPTTDFSMNINRSNAPYSDIPTPSVAGSPTAGINNLTYGATKLPAAPTTTSNGNQLGSLGNTLANYAPSILNIGQGLFGTAAHTNDVAPIYNPYKGKILGNLPKDVSLNPVLNRINRNQNTQFNQIDQTTSASPIARANKTNVFANTQDQIGNLYMQKQQQDNQNRSQRANVYSQLGQQDVQAQQYAQQTNLGIDNQNRANKAAKQNLLNTGIGQAQAVYQNQNTINQQKQNDDIRNKLLYEMFPNLRFYQQTFAGRQQ